MEAVAASNITQQLHASRRVVLPSRGLQTCQHQTSIVRNALHRIRANTDPRGADIC